MGWSDKYKKSIDCNNPKGFSQKAHCAGRKKRENKMSSKLEELVGKRITEEQFDEAAGKKDACYYKVKARYDVWPSAYASGALVKCRKVGAANWGEKSKKKEGFASDAQRRAAFASGYKEKGKKKKKEAVSEVTYKFKGYTNSKMDELDAMLSRAGIKGTPNFNDMTYSVSKKSSKIDKIMKMKGGKKIKPIRLRGKSGMGKISHLGIESVDEALDPYKDFSEPHLKPEYNLNLGAFIDHYQKFIKFMKKHKEVPDKNKREWALAIRNKVGQGMFNGHMSQMTNIMDLLQKGEKFRNLKESVNEYTYGVGDIVKDINPTCPHKGAMGKVKSLNPKSVVFVVMNKGKNYQPGDVLDKTHDQMKKIDESMSQSQAKELLKQLGGNRFRMMVGAKQMSLDKKNGLTMKIGRNAKSISHVRINLKNDLYDIDFIRVRKGIPKIVKQLKGIYADQLRSMFEKYTGLYTSL